MSEYVYDHAWERARARLAALEAAMDPATTGHLERLGVSGGERCLEVGPGGGSIAYWLSDRVGSAGRVLAADLDPRLLDGHGRANLEVRRIDLRNDGIDADGFDLVHARMTLEHIPERDLILKRMVDAVRPGGRVLVEDVDFNDLALQLMARHVRPAEHAGLYRAVWAAAGALMERAGADLSYGARLPDELGALGLVDVGASIYIPLLAAGPQNFIFLSVSQIRDAIVEHDLVPAADLDRFLEIASGPTATLPMAPLVSVWGRKPG